MDVWNTVQVAVWNTVQADAGCVILGAIAGNVRILM